MGIQLKKLQEAVGRSTSPTKSMDMANGQRAYLDDDASGSQTPVQPMVAELQPMAEEDDREKLIKDHYSTRISQLTEQVQYADSKAVAYYEECRNFALRLEV